MSLATESKEDRLKKAKELWAELGDIAVNDDDELEQAFLHFSAGTSKFEVWHYFESNFDCSVVDDLMKTH